MSENIEKCISNRDLFCLTKLIKQHILTFEKLKPEYLSHWERLIFAGKFTFRTQVINKENSLDVRSLIKHKHKRYITC